MTRKPEPPPRDFDENPTWTEENFARAQPFRRLHPDVYESWQRNKGGRPPVESPKIHLGLRMAADVVNGVKATGRGYNARVEKLLREALAKGTL